MPAAVFCIYCGTPVRETALGEPPLASEVGKQSLEPGKGYGIRSLLCGAEGWFAVAAYWLTVLFMFLGWIGEPSDLWTVIVLILFALSPFFAVAGIVFGILGHYTEGWRYAYAGIVLSVLYTLLASPITAYTLFTLPW